MVTFATDASSHSESIYADWLISVVVGITPMHYETEQSFRNMIDKSYCRVKRAMSVIDIALKSIRQDVCNLYYKIELFQHYHVISLHLATI